MKKAVAVVLCVLLIVSTAFAVEKPDLSGYSDEELRELVAYIEEDLVNRAGAEIWFDYGIGQYVPKVKLISGEELIIDRIFYNSDAYLFATVKNAGKGDFEKYIKEAIAFGYKNILEQSSLVFEAHDGKGHKILVSNVSEKTLGVIASEYSE